MIEVLGMFQFVGERLGKYETGPLTDDQAALRTLIERRVYAGVAPAKDPDTKRSPEYPLVVVTNVATGNVVVADGATAYVNALLDVKTVTDKGLGSLVPVSELVFRLLQQQGGVVNENVCVMGCHQEKSLILPPIAENNVVYHSVVQTFHIRAHRIPPAPQ